MLAAWTTAESTATMLAGISVLVFVIYVGYAISRPNMVVWWRWLSVRGVAKCGGHRHMPSRPELTQHSMRSPLRCAWR